LYEVKGVYIIPLHRKHDSGWACMDFVAELADGSKIGFSGWCDDLLLEGRYFRIDCDYESKCLHIWNDKRFAISWDMSSIRLIENIN